MDQDCIFCKILAGDIPANVLYEDDEMLAFHDINPQAPHHFLLIPRKHISGPAAVEESDTELLGKMFLKGTELARAEGMENGFRFVINNGASAGQTVFHLHLHVLGGRALHWPPG